MENISIIKKSGTLAGCCMAICLLCFSCPANAQFASLNKREIARLKRMIDTDSTVRKACQSWKTKAESALKDTPQPIARISTEGKLAGDPDQIKTIASLRDVQKVYALALAYRLYGNKNMLAKATEFLKAWAALNHSVGDPIDDTNLEDMIGGYDLVRADVDKEDRLMIDKWMQETADAELNSSYTTPGRTNGMSNWNSHRIKIIALITYCLHNKDYQPIVDKEMVRQIRINLYPDGSGYDFAVRDALHYHVYTLEPLIAAATVIYRATGKDFFHYLSDTGSSIKKSMDFFIPFVTGEKTHAEFVNSQIAFDKARASNGQKDYQSGAKFNVRQGFHLLTQAAYFEPSYAAVLQQVRGPVATLDWQLVLNQARQPFKQKAKR